MAPRAQLVSLSMNQRLPKPRPALARERAERARPLRLSLPARARRLPALPRADEPGQGRPPGGDDRARGRAAAEDRRQVRRAGRAGVLRRASSGRTSSGELEYVGEVTHGEKVELLQHARATLFPIEWEEPFGLVMIESMACGTPVIATRYGAVPEVIDHGRTGIIVDDWRQMRGRARGGRRARLGRAAPRGRASDSRRSGWWPTTSPPTKPRSPLEVPPLPARPRDPAARGAGARVARGRADSTSSSTRRSSATSGARSSPRSGSPRRCSRACSGSSTSSSTARPPRSARASGAGEQRIANRLGAQSLWLSLAFGIGVAALVVGLAPAIVDAMGGEGDTAELRRHISADRRAGAPVRVPRARRPGVPARRRRPAHAAPDRGRGQRGERDPRGALRLRLRLGDRGLGVGDGHRAGRDGRRVHRVSPARRRAATRGRRGS